LPNVAHATNGYFLIGFGSKSDSMGGTGVAYNMEGMAAAFNPATMIDSGSEFDLGGEMFNAPRAVYHDSGVLGLTDESAPKEWFFIPSMGGTYKWNEDITLGFAFIGAGLQTSYDQAVAPKMFNAQLDDPAFTASGMAGVELIQMQILPSIAYKLDQVNSVGATFVIGAQYFRAQGLQDFGVLNFANLDENGGHSGLTDEGWSHSFGAGIRLGWLGKFMDGDLNVGVNYSSRVYMQEFERYTNLFAEHGDFDIPENYAIGIAYKVQPDLTVAFDVQRIMFHDIASVGNVGPNAQDPNDLLSECPADDLNTVIDEAAPCKTGGDKGLGFGWTNQTVFKLGADWKYNEKINLRGGINYGKAPIPEDQVLFNMLAPATTEWHLTLGGSYNFSEDYEFNFHYVHAFLNTIKGPTPFPPNGSTLQGSNASIAMEQNQIGAGIRIKF
jgi:long-chain fatty acid transport protein